MSVFGNIVKAPVKGIKASYNHLRSIDGIDETAFALSQILPSLAGSISGAGVFLLGGPLVAAGAAGAIDDFKQIKQDEAAEKEKQKEIIPQFKKQIATLELLNEKVNEISSKEEKDNPTSAQERKKKIEDILKGEFTNNKDALNEKLKEIEKRLEKENLKGIKGLDDYYKKERLASRTQNSLTTLKEEIKSYNKGIGKEDKIKEDNKEEGLRKFKKELQDGVSSNVENNEYLRLYKELKSRKKWHWTNPVAMTGMAAGMPLGLAYYTGKTIEEGTGAGVSAATEALGTAAGGVFVGSQVIMSAYGALRYTEGVKRNKALNDTINVISGNNPNQPNSLRQSLESEISGNDKKDKLNTGFTLADQDLKRKKKYNKWLGTGYGAATAIGQSCMATGSIAGLSGIGLPITAVTLLPGVLLTVSSAAARAVWESVEKKYTGEVKEDPTKKEEPKEEGYKDLKTKIFESAEEIHSKGEELSNIKAASILLKSEKKVAKNSMKKLMNVGDEANAIAKSLKPRTYKNWFSTSSKNNTTLTSGLRENTKKIVKQETEKGTDKKSRTLFYLNTLGIKSQGNDIKEPLGFEKSLEEVTKVIGEKSVESSGSVLIKAIKDAKVLNKKDLSEIKSDLKKWDKEKAKDIKNYEKSTEEQKENFQPNKEVGLDALAQKITSKFSNISDENQKDRLLSSIIERAIKEQKRHVKGEMQNSFVALHQNAKAETAMRTARSL